MAFLDRFKPQPRWRHADPVVRAGAIAEVPDDGDHRSVLLELATEDPDLRVRRAAVARWALRRLVRVARDERPNTSNGPSPIVWWRWRQRQRQRRSALASRVSTSAPTVDIAKQSPHDTVQRRRLWRVHACVLAASRGTRRSSDRAERRAHCKFASSSRRAESRPQRAGISALERVNSEIRGA